MEWTNQQAAALKAVHSWLRDPKGKQVFRLFGFAGTGKTTLAKHIAQYADGLVCFACFTGKAALVLRKKGCEGASTIHSLIYKIDDPEAQHPEFVLNPDSPLSIAELAIIDEVSMVDEDLGRDLLSFGKKVLVLGDPMQLKPVRKDEGYFTDPKDRPDVMLTDIRRQTAENPIIRLSIDVREGLGLVAGEYGAARVIHRSQVDPESVLAADQVLAGMNKTRRTFNRRIRELRGRTSPLPQEDDRLVCLRNNRELGLLNGSLWRTQRASAFGEIVTLEVDSLDGLQDPGAVTVPAAFFLGTDADLDWRIKRQHEEFDFGECLTVHKSQGSQWDNVMLFDESATFREQRINHLYTGITRAAERLTVVLP
jgi:exodeoxyribonuclease-5